jgi:acyl carrier protein
MSRKNEAMPLGGAVNSDEILEGVRACAVEALDVPAAKIVPDARLMADLGADSLDLLDLSFQLERRFGIRLSMKDLENRMKAELGDEPVEVNGVYTPAAMARIRRVMTEVPAEELPDGLRAADLPKSFRVSTLIRWVEQALHA